MKRVGYLLRQLLVGLSAGTKDFDEHTQQALAMVASPERLWLEQTHHEFSVLANYEVDLTTEPELKRLAAELERN